MALSHATTVLGFESFHYTGSTPAESDFSFSHIAESHIPVKTEPSVPVAPNGTSDNGKNLAGLVSEVSGVIVALRNEMVQVKLGEKTFVDFPSELFSSKNFINVGQHIKYQVKKDEWGYRYQDLIKDESVGEADVSDIEELLKDI